MTLPDILTHAAGGVRTIQLDRPAKRNSLARPHLDALRHLLGAYAKDPEVRCLVLTGSGNSFCAGADVDEWAEAEARGELGSYGWTEKAHALVEALAAFPRPTVAALNGAAVGAGADLAFACDFRIATASAWLRCGYTAMGFSPDMGGTWFLPRIVRADVARRFIFLNDRWPADAACAAGLVSESIADEAFMAHVAEFAGCLAAGPSLAFGHAKALLRQALTNSLAEQLRAEQAAGLACGHSEDGQEALRAAVEGRAARFSGR